jgi:hypothetical protein
MTISNNKISTAVESNIPFFVRNDHPQFVEFLKAYYRFLEQQDGAVNQIKNILQYRDVDYTIDQFETLLYQQFLHYLPKNVAFDKNLLLKNVKDLYRARGTEKAIRFILNALFKIDTAFYYPKVDILRASDGKWFIEKSIKFLDVRKDGVEDDSFETLALFTNTTIRGVTSNAAATIERVDTYFEKGIPVREFKLSSQLKDFINGEQLTTTVIENGNEVLLTANVFSGSLTQAVLKNRGSLYNVGDRAVVEGDGTGAIVEVATITRGQIGSLGIARAGAGFQANDQLLFTGGFGTGAAGYVSQVLADDSFHPNTYYFYGSTIDLEANTPLDNTVYSNLSSSNVNTAIGNSWNTYVYANCGPLLSLVLSERGSDYKFAPVADVLSNNYVRSLGVIGRIEIQSGGLNYQVGDVIEFSEGSGVGAQGNVTAVAANGMITGVQLIQMGGQHIGGCGYTMYSLPRAYVNSATGSGATIAATAILGDGESISVSSDTIGAIGSIKIISPGVGYTYSPTINMASIGDGTAVVTANVLTGVYTYPGRYLNDDGHLSGYNFLEDRDYYQPFSYVIRANRSVNDYRTIMKDLFHPAGMKMFGDFIIDTDFDNDISNSAFQEVSMDSTKILEGTYFFLDTIALRLDNHTINVGQTVFLEFTSGNLSTRDANNIYLVSNVYNSHVVQVYANSEFTTGNTSYYGNVSIGKMI